jgi:hypothetical protein
MIFRLQNFIRFNWEILNMLMFVYDVKVKNVSLSFMRYNSITLQIRKITFDK